MIRPGLVSISFRKWSAEKVIESVVDAGLQGIEWGGDIHVPHGQVEIARAVGGATRRAGLAVAAYGSYYRVGAGIGPAFDGVIASAMALGAPLIRVWAGMKGSADTNAEERQRVVKDLVHICDRAWKVGIRIGLEWHGGTLTDTLDSARNLLSAANHPNLSTLWQPPVGMTQGEALVGMEAVSSRISNLHVFHWFPKGERLPLSAGEARWASYLHLAHKLPGERWALLEFIPGDDLGGLRRDAATLDGWLGRFS